MSTKDDTVEFEKVFQGHWKRVCTILYRLVGDWDEAEDLALQTFEQLYQRPPQPNGNLSGWLYRVASNLGLNALRARNRRRQYERQAGQAALRDQTDDPAMLAEIAGERQRVRTILARLPFQSASLLILRYSGLSYEELASALQLNPASVGTMLARAERQFANQYKITESS